MCKKIYILTRDDLECFYDKKYNKDYVLTQKLVKDYESIQKMVNAIMNRLSGDIDNVKIWDEDKLIIIDPSKLPEKYPVIEFFDRFLLDYIEFNFNCSLKEVLDKLKAKIVLDTHSSVLKEECDQMIPKIITTVKNKIKKEQEKQLKK